MLTKVHFRWVGNCLVDGGSHFTLYTWVITYDLNTVEFGYNDLLFSCSHFGIPLKDKVIFEFTWIITTYDIFPRFAAVSPEDANPRMLSRGCCSIHRINSICIFLCESATCIPYKREGRWSENPLNCVTWFMNRPLAINENNNSKKLLPLKLVYTILVWSHLSH